MIAPKVSVLMAVHNGEEFLRPAIDSVLAQTLPDFELVVVDDASTDGTVGILHSYSDSRIRLLRNEHNQGAGHARNRGLAEARGEYVAVLDADDVARADRLARQVAFLDAHPEIALVGGAFDMIDTEGRTIGLMCPPTNPTAIQWYLLFGNPIATSTSSFRRATALEAGGYDSTLPVAEDYAFCVRLAASYGLAQLEDVVASYRVHGSGLTGAGPQGLRKETIEVSRRKIRALIGRDVRDSTLSLLSVLGGQDTPSREDVEDAYRVVGECLSTFLEREARTSNDRRLAFRSALGNLQRLADQDQALRIRALQLALAVGAHYSPGELCAASFAGFTLRVLAPEFGRQYVRSVLGRLRGRPRDAEAY